MAFPDLVPETARFPKLVASAFTLQKPCQSCIFNKIKDLVCGDDLLPVGRVGALGKNYPAKTAG
jgi:hypothetical protein